MVEVPCKTLSSQEETTWDLYAGKRLECAPFLVAGIVNVTPDSFYDGGRHAGGAALESVRRMAEHGVHIADIGGESTRPGAAAVSLEEELERVLPVVQGAAGLPIALSVDTYKARVASACLDAGAVIVNDVSACAFDPELLDVLAQYRPGYVLMHSQGRPDVMQKAPRYGNVVDEVLAFFEQRLRMLTAAGLPESHIVLDPGIGFGKTLEHNLALLRAIQRFLVLGRPLYMGISNKSLWGGLLNAPLEGRENATQVATALTAERGARIHRVHDPVATLQTLRVVEALTSVGGI